MGKAIVTLLALLFACMYFIASVNGSMMHSLPGYTRELTGFERVTLNLNETVYYIINLEAGQQAVVNMESTQYGFSYNWYNYELRQSAAVTYNLIDPNNYAKQAVVRLNTHCRNAPTKYLFYMHNADVREPIPLNITVTKENDVVAPGPSRIGVWDDYYTVYPRIGVKSSDSSNCSTLVVTAKLDTLSVVNSLFLDYACKYQFSSTCASTSYQETITTIRRSYDVQYVIECARQGIYHIRWHQPSKAIQYNVTVSHTYDCPTDCAKNGGFCEPGGSTTCTCPSTYTGTSPVCAKAKRSIEDYSEEPAGILPDIDTNNNDNNANNDYNNNNDNTIEGVVVERSKRADDVVLKIGEPYSFRTAASLRFTFDANSTVSETYLLTINRVTAASGYKNWFFKRGIFPTGGSDADDYFSTSVNSLNDLYMVLPGPVTTSWNILLTDTQNYPQNFTITVTRYTIPELSNNETVHLSSTISNIGFNVYTVRRPDVTGSPYIWFNATAVPGSIVGLAMEVNTQYLLRGTGSTSDSIGPDLFQAVRTLSTSNQLVYLTITGNSGASFNASLFFTTSKPTCPTYCPTNYGICSYELKCLCKKGWSGPSCNQRVWDESKFLKAIDGQPLVVFVGDISLGYAPAVVVEFTPASSIDTKLTIRMGNANSGHSYKVSYNTLDESDYANTINQISGSSYYIHTVDPDPCEITVITKYYLMFYTTNPGNVTIQIDSYNRSVPLGELAYPGYASAGANTVVVNPAPGTVCPAYYNVDVAIARDNYQWLLVKYVSAYGCGGKTEYFTRLTRNYNSVFNSSMTGTIMITNCSVPILISVETGSSGVGGGEYKIKVTQVSETQACPNMCSKHGVCKNRVCYCEPGYSGVDCSTRDQKCEFSSATDLAVCNKFPGFLNGAAHFNIGLASKCQVATAEKDIMTAYNAMLTKLPSLDDGCKAELLQTLCDAKFYRCQPTESGSGSKIVFPCYCSSFYERCAGVNGTFPQCDDILGRVAANPDFSCLPPLPATPNPTPRPTPTATPAPTPAPSKLPTQPPTKPPTKPPTQPPTQVPTKPPTYPPGVPTPTPTIAPTPTTAPTNTPTQPATTPATLPPGVPSPTPTTEPTAAPTQAPTKTPTQEPTYPPGVPSPTPTAIPSQVPTANPTVPSTNASDVSVTITIKITISVEDVNAIDWKALAANFAYLFKVDVSNVVIELKLKLKRVNDYELVVTVKANGNDFPAYSNSTALSQSVQKTVEKEFASNTSIIATAFVAAGVTVKGVDVAPDVVVPQGTTSSSTTSSQGGGSEIISNANTINGVQLIMLVVVIFTILFTN